jgi:uncharacterized protein YciI
MFVVSLTYKCDLEEVEKHLAEHIKYLEKQYAKGNFLVSGPKVPRTGGVIIAKCSSLDELDLILKQDPFYKEEVAEYSIIEFVANTVADELKVFKETP